MKHLFKPKTVEEIKAELLNIKNPTMRHTMMYQVTRAMGHILTDQEIEDALGELGVPVRDMQAIKRDAAEINRLNVLAQQKEFQEKIKPELCYIQIDKKVIKFRNRSFAQAYLKRQKLNLPITPVY